MLDCICKGIADLQGRETSEKSKMKICLRRDPATLDFPTGHLNRLAIGAVVHLCLKLFQNPVMNST